MSNNVRGGGGIFSEQGRDGHVDDALNNATGVENAVSDLKEGMRERTTMSGVRLLSDCGYCNLQWAGIIKWIEIHNWFLGIPVPGTKATQGGVATAFRCRSCQQATKFVIPWNDITRWVGEGVNIGALPKNIYAAREEVMRRRAAAAQQQRR